MKKESQRKIKKLKAKDRKGKKGGVGGTIAAVTQGVKCLDNLSQVSTCVPYRGLLIGVGCPGK